MAILRKFLKLIFKVIFFTTIIYFFFDRGYVTLEEHKKKIPNKFQLIKIDLQVNEAEEDNDALVYILIWTPNDELVPFKSGQYAFMDNDCPHQNCFVAREREFLGGDYTRFDAIIFYGKDISINKSESFLPKRRHDNQTYIFAMHDPASQWPICDEKYEDFFNITWSYRVTSDVMLSVYKIVDKEDETIAPNLNPNWNKPKEPVRENIQQILLKKHYAALYNSPTCNTKPQKYNFVWNLRQHLKNNYMDVNVLTPCKKDDCFEGTGDKCSTPFNEYYFHLAVEQVLSEDYVTEAVAVALNNDAVPIVYGGANYSRFLPPNSYIDARALGARNTATLMTQLITNRTVYLQYLQWHKYYKVTKPMHSVCEICRILNKKRKFPAKNKFRDWWNGKGNCKNTFDL